MNKSFKTSYGVIILAIAAGLAIFLIWSSQNKQNDSAVLKMNGKGETGEDSSSSIEESFKKGQEEQAASASVYEDSDYGFRITLPKGNSDFKAITEKGYGGDGVVYVRMLLRTNSPSEEENRMTKEKYPGYFNLFTVAVWGKEALDKVDGICSKDPKNAACPQRWLGWNDTYVWDLELAQRTVPDDLVQLDKLLRDSEDYGKAISFKLFSGK